MYARRRVLPKAVAWIFDGDEGSHRNRTRAAGVSKTDNLMTVVPTEEWKNYSFDVTAGDDTEWGVTLLLQSVCGAVEGCQVTAYFDNVSITTV